MNLKKKHIKQLDVFRALAALSVCSVHFTYDSYFHKYFAQGVFVQLFFALSGFVIAYNYHSILNNLNIFFEFSIRRFKRLYPLHLFFLILFLILEIVKLYLVYKFNIEPNNAPFEKNNLKNFLLNIFFLQHFANEFSFNGPSWSISVEMMLYLTCGMSLIIFKNRFFLFLIFFFYIIFFIIFFRPFYSASLSIYAFYSGLYSFCIGYIFFLIFDKIKFKIKKNIYLDIIFYILLIIFLMEIFYFKLVKQEYIYSMIFGLIFMLSCFLNEKFILFKIFFNNFFSYLGKISYSIYMSHLIIFYIFDNFLKYVLKFKTKFDGIIYLDLNKFESNIYTLMIYIIVIFISNLTYKFIEIKFYKKI